MSTPRASSINPEKPAPFAKSGEREGSINQAVRDAYMLDTSAGQFFMLKATAGAFGVPINALQRRVVSGYSALDDNLDGYQDFLEEFEESTSPEETMLVKQMIDNNTDLRRNLEDYGGWRFLTGALDPVNIIPVPFAIGKGFAAGAGAALKKALPIVGGTELARHLIDPTSTVEETLFNTVGGALFMGLIGGAVGKIPKNTISVSDALGRFIPPPGQTSMFSGVPWHMGTPGGVFKRLTANLKSAVSNGEFKSKTIAPDRIKIREEFDNIDVDSGESVHVDIDDIPNVLTAELHGGILKIVNVFVPESMRDKGIGTAAYKSMIKYAQDNGLEFHSDQTLMPGAVKIWNNLADEGYNVKKNQNVEPGTDRGSLISKDGKAVFTLEKLIDPDAKLIPLELREEIADYQMALDKIESANNLLKTAIGEAKQKVKDAPVAGGAKTKAKKELDELVETLGGKDGTEWQAVILRSKIADRNVAAALMLDAKTVKDWDLLPTGYNTILGKTDQFPWWSLIKTPLREFAPDLAVKYQMFALKFGATPGLNNKGNRISASTGPSVESLTIEYTGRWLVATRKAQKIYRKYVGAGESSSQVKQFVIDQAQRVRSSSNQLLGGEEIKTTSDGKLTIREFDTQISIAIAQGGKHNVAEVAEAASEYIRVLKEIGDEGKELGVFASQRNIARRIEKVLAQLDEFDEKWGKKYQIGVGDLETQAAKFKELYEELKALDELENSSFVDREMGKAREAKNAADLDQTIRDFNSKMEAEAEAALTPLRERRAELETELKELEAEFGDLKKLDDEVGNLKRLDGESDADFALREDEEGLRIDEERADDGGFDDPPGTPSLEQMQVQDRIDKIKSELNEIGLHEAEQEFILTEARADEGGVPRDAPTPKDAPINPRRAEIEAELSKFDESMSDLPPTLRNMRDELELEHIELQDLAQSYKDSDNPNFIHRMWVADEVKAREAELKEMLFNEFRDNPKNVFKDKDGKVIPEHPDVIMGRVNETYASILRDAETGGNLEYAPKSRDKRVWLEARKNYLIDNPDDLPVRTQATQLKIVNNKLDRIKKGGEFHGGGPIIARRLKLDDVQLLKSGFIEGNVNNWMRHYVARTAPVIETARMFGDGQASAHINALHDEVFLRALDETDPVKKAALFKAAEDGLRNMQDLRDIVHGTFAIPDNPDAITPRVLRMLRNFNILGAMGRSVLMALGDLGNVVVSQGLMRSLGHSVEHFASGITDGKIKMMRDEVDLAGSVSEVILGMRYHQMTDFGAAIGTSLKHPRLSRIERGLANASQRFFLYNLLGPWTDMARRFSGGMLQSRLIENSILWKAGTLNPEEQKIMSRLGINKQQAIQFADEWERSGSLAHKKMFIANTEEWVSEQAKRTFRAAMNTEINRMVPTPGAVDKPKALLKSEWWKVVGQYRGFSIAATHRIMGAGLHSKASARFSGAASMIGIAMIVDSFKRPDYIQMPLEQQLLRAVELSGITGIFLDLNDTIERASAGTIGIRPALGMDIRERNPNWANRMGTIGAVPNQWLTLMYALTSDNAETDDLARSIRYMIPYNNLLWWNEAFNRAQRSTVDMIEGTE